MQNKILVSAIFLFLLIKAHAQSHIIDEPNQISDSIYIATVNLTQTTDSVFTNETNPMSIVNPIALQPFFEKLQALENSSDGKVRIFHVGDSHIQADFLTNAAKTVFQQKFGNAGLGFVFPHKLAQTNGTSTITYKTNALFLSNRNVQPVNSNVVGVAGYSLSTTNKNSAIEITIKNPEDYTSSIKIITPKNNKFFDLGLGNINLIPFQNYKTVKVKTHKVIAGETLSSIARKYNTTIAEIKKLNKLKGNKIASGKTLKIGTYQNVESKIDKSNFEVIDLQDDGNSFAYKAKVLLNKFYLLPNHVQNEFYINGLILENNNPGITYSGIGVNGAKLSDYNKFDLFFEQMQALQPDLLIISFGTNESFDKVSTADFMTSLQTFINKIKKYTPTVSILVTTPPPSTLYKKYPNTYINDYSQALLDFTQLNKTIAVFNLYEVFGGSEGVNISKQKGFMAKDEVHYTKNGYDQQGTLLAESILKAYNNYILSK